ncbi:nucleotidyltransferase family protein [Hydrogenimonas sp.]
MDRTQIIEFLTSHRESYRRRFGVVFVGLFGSVARQEATKESDIDILYEIEEGKKLSLFAYLKLVKELERSLHQKVDLVRLSTVKPALKSYIQQDLIHV